MKNEFDLDPKAFGCVPRSAEPEIVPLLNCPGDEACCCTSKSGRRVYHSPYWRDEFPPDNE